MIGVVNILAINFLAFPRWEKYVIRLAALCLRPGAYLTSITRRYSARRQLLISLLSVRYLFESGKVSLLFILLPIVQIFVVNRYMRFSLLRDGCFKEERV